MKHTFEKYLNKRAYSRQTIEQIKRTKRRYRLWLEQNNSSVYLANHWLAVQYIEHMRNDLHFSPKTINLKLAHLRHYYNFLSTTRNPFFNLRVRGQKKTVSTGWLNEDELLSLYIGLAQKTQLERRVKILAGFYIFQGVSTRDIAELLVSHLSIEKSKVIIPETKRGNERTLKLNPIQVQLLRDEFKEDHNADTLIYQVLGKSLGIRQVTTHLNSCLLKENDYKSLAHLRYSVIQNWLKRHNLRQVQYNAGHRYITTTEKMLEGDYEGLKLAIEGKHPLG